MCTVLGDTTAPQKMAKKRKNRSKKQTPKRIKSSYARRSLSLDAYRLDRLIKNLRHKLVRDQFRPDTTIDHHRKLRRLNRLKNEVKNVNRNTRNNNRGNNRSDITHNAFKQNELLKREKICRRRYVRDQIIHALKRAGKGKGNKKPRWTKDSKIRC